MKSTIVSQNARLRRVWIIGCGAMGGTLLARWLEAGLPQDAVTIIDPKPTGVPTGFTGAVVESCAAAFAVAPAPTLVVLGIKPQTLGALSAEMAPWLTKDNGVTPVLISMLAGASCETVAANFPGVDVIRIMPNTPARVGLGVTALFNAGADAAAVEAAYWLGDMAGSTVWLEDEDLFHAVTGLSGSGPAYVFRFIEAFAAAGVASGLSPAQAQALALQTVIGSAELARQSDLTPTQLREQVTSPNGTTQAGLEALDGGRDLTDLLTKTVQAATDRSREMAADAAKARG